MCEREEEYMWLKDSVCECEGQRERREEEYMRLKVRGCACEREKERDRGRVHVT